MYSNQVIGVWSLTPPSPLLLTGRFSKFLPRRDERADGATMPFSKYNIDPDRIEALWAAFNRVCEALFPRNRWPHSLGIRTNGIDGPQNISRRATRRLAMMK
jgi:hypothetical protein